MNERLQKIAKQAGYNIKELDAQEQMVAEKFVELIVELCIETLEFYGHTKAIPDIVFMAKNRLGVMK
jgi:hypothetical protein